MRPLAEVARKMCIGLRHIEREPGRRLRRCPAILIRDVEYAQFGIMSSAQGHIENLSMPAGRADLEVALATIDLPQQIAPRETPPR